MIFTSTAREDIAQPASLFEKPWLHTGTVREEDPEPWLWGSGARTETPSFYPSLTRFAPRPEYRAPLNPLLRLFRDLPEEDLAEFAREVIALAADPRVADLLTPAYLVVHVEHASKVLTRWAALGGIEQHDNGTQVIEERDAKSTTRHGDASSVC